MNRADGGPGLDGRPAIIKVKQRKINKKKKKMDNKKEKWRAGPGLPSCLGGPWGGRELSCFLTLRSINTEFFNTSCVNVNTEY